MLNIAPHFLSTLDVKTPQTSPARLQSQLVIAPNAGIKPLTTDLVQFSSGQTKKEKRQQDVAKFLKGIDIDIDYLTRTPTERNEALESLDRAFTHASVKGNNNYEYLEFLGDAVLQNVVREYFFHQLPRGEEQKYLKSHHILSMLCCRNDFLTEIAKDLGVISSQILLINHDDIREQIKNSTPKKDTEKPGKPVLSEQEWESRWRGQYNKQMAKIPADCMEGLIGALSIIDPSRESIKDMLHPYLDIVMGLVEDHQLEEGSIDYMATLAKFKTELHQGRSR